MLAIAAVKRHMLVEVEDSRRVDQRRYEKRRRTAASVIAQARRRETRDFRLRRRAVHAAALLVCAQARKRPRPIRIARRNLANQIEK